MFKENLMKTSLILLALNLLAVPNISAQNDTLLKLMV